MTHSNNDTKNETIVTAEEKHLVLDHSYDGILELNNPLPSWWAILFYVGVAFAVGYIAYYIFLGGPSLQDEFNKDYAHVVLVQEEFKKQNSAFKPDVYATYSTPEGIKAGAAIYEENCLSCHLEKGKGDVGPNLTDEYWIKAKGTPETVYDVVFNGSEENGMPVWSEILSAEDIYKVTAYVQSLHHTHVKDGKAPQGEKVEDK